MVPIMSEKFLKRKRGGSIHYISKSKAYYFMPKTISIIWVTIQENRVHAQKRKKKGRKHYEIPYKHSREC